MSVQYSVNSQIVTVDSRLQPNIHGQKECIGKVYAPDEYDKNVWTVEGEPTTTITVEKPATVELTCATVVNRIPDVINSKAGYVPTADMGELMYRTKTLNEYILKD